jgi:hypothetical protein
MMLTQHAAFNVKDFRLTEMPPVQTSLSAAAAPQAALTVPTLGPLPVPGEIEIGCK